uniref:Uncharacterized protein n=1 Tax=Ananas comosus var. bracteatus TaxID=296719 RepID=A0A6V7Q5T3_ANACO|nr:unnamed protein product [Ananas comosus var. bracteatus]
MVTLTPSPHALPTLTPFPQTLHSPHAHPLFLGELLAEELIGNELLPADPFYNERFSRDLLAVISSLSFSLPVSPSPQISSPTSLSLPIFSLPRFSLPISSPTSSPRSRSLIEEKSVKKASASAAAAADTAEAAAWGNNGRGYATATDAGRNRIGGLSGFSAGCFRDVGRGGVCGGGRGGADDCCGSGACACGGTFSASETPPHPLPMIYRPSGVSAHACDCCQNPRSSPLRSSSGGGGACAATAMLLLLLAASQQEKSREWERREGENGDGE